MEVDGQPSTGTRVLGVYCDYPLDEPDYNGPDCSCLEPLKQRADTQVGLEGAAVVGPAWRAMCCMWLHAMRVRHAGGDHEEPHPGGVHQEGGGL